ncbi:MAG: biotin/lipoyl-binding protein [Bacteroidales bacterium]|nr:biotin/lipoyl-binding protein [Bacteroidales bacterium]NTV18869.1 biotin/lipoyl-binding protein [Bacteroidales bacterium]
MKEYKLKINGNDYNVTITDIEDTIAEVEVNGIPFKVEIDRPLKKQATVVQRPAVPTGQNSAPKPTASVKPPVASGSESAITSPLPGVILEVVVKEGDAVKKGQKLMVLEAMKMENVIEASADGKIISIKANKGDSVLEGATLIIIG